MNRRKYISIIGGASVGILSSYKLSSQNSTAQINNFKINDLDENNTVLLSSSSEEINGLNLFFDQFKIRTDNIINISEDLEIKFYARMGNNNYKNEIKTINVSLSKKSEYLNKLIDSITITDNNLSGELPTTNDDVKKLYIKIKIDHEDFTKPETFETSIGLDIEKENMDIYGDGSDGLISRTENGIENKSILNTESFIIEDDITREFENGTIIIHAQNEIDIRGNLICKSKHSGGSGGSPSSGNGENGQSGAYIGAGGSGGDSNHGTSGSDRHGDDGEEFGGAGGGGGGSCNGGNEGGSGGNGGGDKENSVPSETTVDSIDTYNPLNEKEGWSGFYDLPDNPSSSGGGGGAGGSGESGSNGNGAGGDGGYAGGLILLIAPKITIDGIVSVEGGDGENGKDGGQSDSCNQIGAGGGGAGGSGGLIYTVAEEYISNGEIKISGGFGGLGGAADGWAGTGGDGTNGKNGEHYNIKIN